MAYIYVDGVEFPYPARGLDVVVTTPVDSARNTQAEVVGQRIGRDQYKINNLQWLMLSAEQWSFILKKFKTGFGVPVTFPDPVENAWITLIMYPGDRSAQPYWIDENDMPTRYKDCKVNIIDCGV
ncbi:MAG: hypothetical protein Q4C58_14230 [Eubacteriales bacterium]|nr:hypothetical protein [Eubacteriales bacterium]